MFWICSVHGDNCLKCLQLGPGSSFSANPDLVDMDLDVEILFLSFFLIPTFHMQIPRFPKSWNLEIRKMCPYSSGRHFSESCAPRKLMQNRIDKIFSGRAFKNTSHFNLRTLNICRDHFAMKHSQISRRRRTNSQIPTWPLSQCTQGSNTSQGALAATRTKNQYFLNASGPWKN